jgi:hypothetical protein
MLVYTPTITPRIEYVFRYIGEILGLQIVITDSKNEYKSTDTVKINYSDQQIQEKEYQIIPCGLLMERGIRRIGITIHHAQHFPIFFKTSGTLSFDLPAAVFYLISRYEEYLPYQPDLYGRYPHEDSLASKENFLQRPLVDDWMNEWSNQLKIFFPTVPIKHPSFRFIPTYDIDIAWCYLHKGWIRNLGGAIKNFNSLPARIRVLTGIGKDPYDCYNSLQQLHEAYEQTALYFFLVAKKKSSLDKNTNPDNTTFRQLIQKTSKHAIVGLHPSGYSHTDQSIVNNEKDIIQKIISQPVIHSRQHYLKFSLPITYNGLIEAGIEHDYSMGYGTINGFRASTSRPYLWYNLATETVTNLRIHPFAWMDANAYYESKFSPEEALNELTQLYESVQKNGGDFITVSHNHLLGENSEWKNWPKLYAEFVKQITAKNQSCQ